MSRKHLYIITSILTSVFLLACTLQERENGTTTAFVRVSENFPRYFENGDGTTWIPVMINIIVPNSEENAVFDRLEHYFREFSQNGGNAVRLWLSSPFWEIEDTQQGAYNPDKLARIDKLISLARQYNIRLKFTLQHIRSIKPETGRSSWSNKAILSDSSGGTFRNIDHYINSPEGKKNYLSRAKVFSERYRDNEQIFSWELWNEMDAVDASDWYPFSEEILDSVKRLFPNHLVAQTLGSLHSPDADDRYEDLLTLQENDYITVHRYLDPGTDWHQYEHVHGPIDLLISQSIQFVYRDDVLKPIVPNEHGAVEANHAGPHHLYRTDSVGVFIHDMIFAPFFTGASGCGAMWHWDSYVDRQNLWYHYKRFTTAIDGLDPIKEKFVPFHFEKDSVRCYGLKGQTSLAIWCRDSENNWMTELQQGIPPKEKRDFTIDVAEFTNTRSTTARIYDPWTDTWTTAAVQENRVVFPPFTRSAIVVIDR